MKTLVSIFVILVGTAGFFLTRANEDDHRTCSCSGVLCSCDVTCLDLGEMPTCNCSALTCICKCVPKDANNVHYSLPTMNDDQVYNSTQSEKYFRGLGTSKALTIANGIKNMREAIQSGNVNLYVQNATLVEEAYAGLSASQISSWESWHKNIFRK